MGTTLSRAIRLGIVCAVAMTVSCGPTDRPPPLDPSEPAPTNAAGGERNAPDPGAGGVDGSGGAGADSFEACVPELPSGFCFVAVEDDRITRVNVSGTDDTVEMRSSFHGGVTGSADLAEEQGHWSFDFGPPSLGFFVPGDYEQRASSDDPASLSLFGDDTVCNEESEFDVRELAWDVWGNLTRFSATFEMRCLKTRDVLRGAVNFNATGTRQQPPSDPSNCEVETPLGLCWVYQGGNPVQRQEQGPASLGADDAEFEAWMTPRGLQLHVLSPDTSTNFLVHMDAPEGETLAPGKYENTDEIDPLAPSLTQPCDQPTGEFDLLAFQLDESVMVAGYPQVVQANVNFNFRCGSDPARAFAKIRYTRPD